MLTARILNGPRAEAQACSTSIQFTMRETGWYVRGEGNRGDDGGVMCNGKDRKAKARLRAGLSSRGGLLSLGDLHLDLFRLRLFGFRKMEIQHSLRILRFHFALINRIGKREASDKPAV